jgi:hypothetical protein
MFYIVSKVISFYGRNILNRSLLKNKVIVIRPPAVFTALKKSFNEEKGARLDAKIELNSFQGVPLTWLSQMARVWLSDTSVKSNSYFFLCGCRNDKFTYFTMVQKIASFGRYHKS